ncbi:MAG: hypothetical protein IJE62_07370, partial [Clostridia bacterium]|nr:hypothetical protein [Clostridia bacterium]
FLPLRSKSLNPINFDERQGKLKNNTWRMFAKFSVALRKIYGFKPYGVWQASASTERRGLCVAKRI